MLLVFYGKGKGKTTAALGTAVRALGRGWNILMVQFMKKGDYGELEFFNSLSAEETPFKNRMRWYMLGTEEFVSPGNLGDEVASINMALAYGFLLNIFPKLLREFNPQLTIMDELGIAIHIGIVDEDLGLRVAKVFAENRDRHGIITGRYVPSPIKDVADLVTEVREVKHYFRKGYVSLKGLDL